MTPPITRRNALKAGAAAGLGCGLAVDAPATIPLVRLGSRVTTLKVVRLDTDHGPRTVICRTVERPELCRRCPAEACDVEGGFCVVVAPRYVPDLECADYTIDASGREGVRP